MCFSNQALAADAEGRATEAQRWRGRFAPRHRRCGLPSTFCPALRAGHQAAEADGRAGTQACRPPAAYLQRR